jgi:Antibiotic biosynthesis monooxygenase
MGFRRSGTASPAFGDFRNLRHRHEGRRFFPYERWESQAALDLHMATPHFKHLKQTGAELVSEPFEINKVKRILTGAAAACCSQVLKANAADPKREIGPVREAK